MTFGYFVVMSTFASLPFETMILGLENTLTSDMDSNALKARRKSSKESCPENPRALCQFMLDSERPAPAAWEMESGTRDLKVSLSVLLKESFWEPDDEEDVSEFCEDVLLSVPEDVATVVLVPLESVLSDREVLSLPPLELLKLTDLELELEGPVSDVLLFELFERSVSLIP